MSELYKNVYNPDVLTCLANLSNDEVFTPPEVANAMLDMLPQELFDNPETTFLDPACKSGVFLREITKRLDKGLEDKISDRQERIDHILHNQIFGIAITELTSLMSRRSLYCSKYADSVFSVSHFDDTTGNVRYKRMNHTWKNSKCIYCGASQLEMDRGIEYEEHAYEFIHVNSLKELFNNMKFDVIISNPPYQLNDGGNGVSATPIYNKFIEQAKKLNPHFISMIVPSRWYAGGKGLDSFRKEMLNDSHIVRMIDYVNAKDCFPGTSIGGGVNYFLWDREKSTPCLFTNIHDGKESTQMRNLDEYSIFVRYNEAINIIHKVIANQYNPVNTSIIHRNPFGISSAERGTLYKKELALYSSDGISYIDCNKVVQNNDIVDDYKLMISKVTSEHAGEPDSSGQFRVISTNKVLEPKEVCTDSYLILYHNKNRAFVENYQTYLKTRFYRFLLLQAVTSINLSKDKFCFIPKQDFSKPWTDKELYIKYDLTDDEVAFIESMIRPMDSEEK